MDAGPERSEVTKQHAALKWAAHGDDDPEGFDGYGEDAEITIQAYTADSRARVIDTFNAKTVGDVGSQALRTWLIAGAIVDAPWIEGDEGLLEQKELLGKAHPPALADWLDAELESLNDLTAGN